MPATIRAYEPGDEAFILRLNAACTPEVGDMDASRFAQIRGAAHRILVAEVDGEAVGFLILLRAGAAYDSDNFAWFEDRFDRHLYVDRIAIDEMARGEGVGAALYEAAIDVAREAGDPRITAEVNELPPNPVSLAFHDSMGFQHLGTRLSDAGKIVVLLERPVAA